MVFSMFFPLLKSVSIPGPERKANGMIGGSDWSSGCQWGGLKIEIWMFPHTREKTAKVFNVFIFFFKWDAIFLYMTNARVVLVVGFSFFSGGGNILRNHRINHQSSYQPTISSVSSRTSFLGYRWSLLLDDVFLLAVHANKVEETQVSKTTGTQRQVSSHPSR